MTNSDPKSFNLPDVELLKPEHIDNVARALLSLTREVAVLSDRVIVLETLLEKHNVLASENVDTFTPDEAFEARSQADMQNIIGNVLGALQGSSE